MHCFAGCRTEDVLKAIGLTMKDLVPPSFTEIRPQSIRSVREAVNTQPKCTRNYAKQLWLAADNSDGHVARHPYAKSKGITWAAGAGRGMASGRVIGKDADCLIIPCRDLHTKSLLAVQAINRDGEKQTFGSLGNGALVLGNTLDKSLRWFVVEGWADAVSLVFHHYDGNAVAAAAFGAGRMVKVAKLIRDASAPERLVILDDREQAA